MHPPHGDHADILNEGRHERLVRIDLHGTLDRGGEHAAALAQRNDRQ